LCITVTSNIKSFFYTAYCSKKYLLVVEIVSMRHFGTGAKLSDTSALVPNSLDTSAPL